MSVVIKNSVGPNWTDEQLAAINAYSHPVIVSAAAGSGKTAVLVERTIRLLCDESLNIPADSLLAVTFTNDAASQMREKLSDAFEKKAIENPDSVWIQKQQSLLRLAGICTINSFCFDMVRSNLDSTDFQSGVRIMDDNESKMITDRALTDVFENAYETRHDVMERLINDFCRENDNALRAMVLKLYDFLRSLPFRKQWCDSVIESFNDGSRLEMILSGLKECAVSGASSLTAASNRLRSIIRELKYHSAAKEVLEINCDYCELLAAYAKERSFADCKELFANPSWLSLAGARQKADEKKRSTKEENDLYESAKSLFDHIKALAKEIGEYFKYSEEQCLSDCDKTVQSFKDILLLTDELFDEVKRIKIEKNALDFSDTELITVELLAYPESDGTLMRTALAKEIVSSGRYKLILIDEFQDVNNLQEVIFKAISDSDDMSAIGSNLFAVGDVKQAIYRFRQANPMIFMNTRLQGQNPNSPVREILLTKNFRSRKSVLDFANYLFSSLMSKEVGEVDYTESEALVNGAEFEGEDSLCEIIAVNTQGDAENGIVLGEYDAVAAKIRKMIDDKVTVSDKNGRRPCCPGDFCVLTRNNIPADDIAPSFERLGLKIQSSGVSGYLRSREISLLINLLSVTVNPMRDIAMASVMLSPILNFSDDELALVKLHNRKNRLYKNILELSQDPQEVLLREKCRDAVALIKELRALSSGLTLTRLIKKIYDITDIFSMAAAYEDGAKKCANLHLMLDYARSYEESSKDGLPGFLRYIDYIQDKGGDFAEALTITESDDAVCFKTIHKSKGLEYPFVFVCQLSKRFNKRDLYGRMVISSTAGVGLSYLDYKTLTKRSTVFADYVYRQNLLEMLSEELRLLYVAVTRAKEGLYIVMDIDPTAIQRAQEFSYEIDSHIVPHSLVQKASCMQDWILMAMLKHPQFSVVRDELAIPPYAEPSGYPQINVSQPVLKGDFVNEDESAQTVEPDLRLANKILKSFDFSNDLRLTQSEAKMSVSELVHDDPINFFPKVPRLMDAVADISAAQKGTLMHRFMQLCDYESASASVSEEVNRLKESGAFTEQEASLLNINGLKRFFDSELYKRMSKSKNVMREKSFIVKFSDIDADESLNEQYAGTDGMMQGIADCIFEEDDGYVLLDYKTDRVNSVSELNERYSAQLMLYKAAFGIILDKPVIKSYIYSLSLSEAVEVEV